jgi:hypothetical protein
MYFPASWNGSRRVKWAASRLTYRDQTRRHPTDPRRHPAKVVHFLVNLEWEHKHVGEIEERQAGTCDGPPPVEAVGESRQGRAQ